MLQIHEELFQYLIDINKKDSSVRFSMRKTNRYNRLDDGYWFVGNDKYLQVSFLGRN